MIAKVDDTGSYTFPKIYAGKHTLQVFVGDKIVKDIVITIPSDNYDLEI
jgi:hypothetical protein